MLTEIEIGAFKSIIHKRIPLKPLTLLTGLNNVGKSSVIQALRMFCGSFDNSSPLLSGHGPFDELHAKAAPASEPISIVCVFDDSKRSETFSLKDTKVCSPGRAPLSYYLSADRWGPKITLPLDRRLGQFPTPGSSGEYVAGFLDKLRNATVPKTLHHPDAQGITLEYQVIGWINEIAPGVELRYETDSKRDAAHLEFNNFRPTNVGFGLSYCLPILAAVLGFASEKPAAGWENDWGNEWDEQRAARGVLIMIENPEAHLHPSGQTALGRLLALGARCGLQLVIETHSDHLMDGIRIAVRQGELDPSQAAFHYFSKVGEGETTFQTPKIDKSGKLEFWPEGFFDQTLKNRSKLVR